MKKIALISLMAAAVALTSTSALARDHRNNDGDRDYRGDNHNERSYDSHSGRQSGRHYERYDDRRAHHKNRHSKASYYRQSNNHHGKYYGKHYGQSYGHGKHHYGHNGHHSYNSFSSSDYWEIVGGTILLNELLYHGHNNH